MEGVKKIRSSKLMNVDPPAAITFDDLYKTGHRRDAGYYHPQYGPKGYECRDSSLIEPNYKIKKICFARPEDKEKKRDHFLDAVMKLAKTRPDCKMPHDDWSAKSYISGGSFLKGKKISMTERIMQQVKKKAVPGPGQYPVKDVDRNGSRAPIVFKQAKEEKYCSFMEDAKAKS